MTILSNLFGEGAISDEDYGATWSGVTNIGPSKNVVYDKVETLVPKATPTFTGQATIPTINLTGGQIAFPATAVPSADPNTLDDYEEGAWTFGILFSNDEGDDPTYSRTAGFYTKIGNMCFLSGYMSMNNKGTSTGDAQIIELPFTISNTDGGEFAPSMRFNNITFTDFYMGFGVKNTTRIVLEENDEGVTETALTNANFTNTSTIRICGQYRIE